VYNIRDWHNEEKGECISPPFLRGCNGYLGFGGALWGRREVPHSSLFKKYTLIGV
jgi:hypothetical protein